MLRSSAIKNYAGVLSGSLVCLWSLGYTLSAPALAHSLQIRFVPEFHGLPMRLDEMNLADAAAQKLSVTRLDFLVSDLAMRRAGGTWLEKSDSVAYVTTRNVRTGFSLDGIPDGHYDRIRFLVGLKPLVNHSDAANYPAGHPLNPTVNGLHWGWMGGYVFLALEGNWTRPDGQIGGYAYHLATDRQLMTVEVPVDITLTNDRVLRVAFKLDKVFTGATPIALGTETASTHSRANDVLADLLRGNITNAFAAESGGLSVAENETEILGEGGSGGILREPVPRKALGIRASVGAELPGSPSPGIKIGPSAIAAFPYGVPPSGGRAPADQLRGNITKAFAAESSGVSAANNSTEIPGEGGSSGVQREDITRKASGIRASTGAEPLGSPSPGIKIGPSATAASPHGVPPSGGRAPADQLRGNITKAFAAESSDVSVANNSTEIPGEGGSSGVQREDVTRKASGIRTSTGAEPLGSPSPGIEIGPSATAAFPYGVPPSGGRAYAVGETSRTFKTLVNGIAQPAEAGTPYVEAKREIGPTATPYPLSFPAYFPRPDLPRDNPLTAEGVELGRRLFFDTRLSVNDSQSCASCHAPDGAFTDGKAVAVGAEGHAGNRNAMALLNLAWKSSFFWDGRAPSLREQVLQPIQNPIEMHESLSNVVAKLGDDAGYPALFNQAFGHSEITPDRIARALEQFLLTQLACDSKFDQVLRGEATFTVEEQRGFELFHTEYDPRHEQRGADCFHCHGGPLFQSQSFANNGLDIEFGDSGRVLVTGREGDKGRFAVPSLRNAEVTGPYMHDGRFKTLQEVVEHYCTGIQRSATLDPNLAKHPDGGVPLADSDKKALVAFLKTLTDQKYRHAGVELASDNHAGNQ